MKIERTVVIATLSVIVGLGIPVVTLGETMDDLVKRDGLYYKKVTDVPFSGKITEKKIQGTFRDGKRDGPWVYYHDNGQLRAKGTAKNDEFAGVWISYWENRRLQSKVNFKNGKKEGPWVGYYDNGQLRIKGAWKNDKREGPWVEYSSKGRLLEQGEN